MNKLKKILCMLMALLMVLTVINTTDVSASVRPKLNKKKVTIYVGKTFNLKIKNYKEKVKWFSEDKRIATVNKKGKVTAKKEGTVTICATASNFVLLCKVKVKRKKTKLSDTNTSITNRTQTQPSAPTSAPTPTPTPQISAKEKVKNICLTNGTVDYSSSDGTYYWIGKVNYYNGNQFFCRLAYSSTYDKITLVELSGNIMTTIELNDATASTCEVKFFDGDSVMYGNGILYKNLMSGDNAATFTDYNIPIGAIYSGEKLATIMAKLSLTTFNIMMNEYSSDVSSSSFGFPF